MPSDTLVAPERPQSHDRIDWTAKFSSAPGETPSADDALVLPHWSEADWRNLLERAGPRRARASEVVIARGALDRALYFVVSGWLEVGITQVDGVSISQIARIGAASVVGEQSFFDGQPRSANVWAVSDAELLRLEFDEYERFADERPALARDFLFAVARVLSVRLRHTTVRVRR